MPIKNPDLRRAVKAIKEERHLIQALNKALNAPDFEEFTVKIEGFKTRYFDHYFHPSQHATWNLEQLVSYMTTKPEDHVYERMELTSTLAITQGHFWHMFIQHILKESKLLVEDEVGFVDEVHRRRGHMDGLLLINGQYEGLEIKTINQFKIAKMINEAALKEFKPEYWAQAQEYLDVFELPVMRFLFISPTYPFTMNEFVVKADKKHQAARRDTYRAALALAKELS